ncbi:UDP-N-acetylglucosamine 1-carboxyvinyltransferase [Streptomyces noursei]|uniref:UDP-N-acetylglucosamine 1-carboxyvinyltransferase n=1 Tax=Streptomyces noursei TaxID=1971 RepID=UPI0023B7C650|nr:UDP-N-acetylglucosamine 1-carboxyvinyltransferase [Streptomyces noursei]
MTHTLIPEGTNGAAVRITGGRPLNGRVEVQGSKNIALHLYAAAFLVDTPLVLVGAPAILDTGVCAQILTHAGMPTTVDGGQFTVTPHGPLQPDVHGELGRQVRTTCVLASALLARTGRVRFPYPGGDAFCARLIDRHLAAMQAAGAVVTAGADGIRAECPRGVRPFTVDVVTAYGPSLGATVSAMLLASRAPGRSLIVHPSVEPEVTETARFLTERGVRIEWGPEGLHVTGSSGPIEGGAFMVAGDRIEAATLIMAAAATGGALTLGGISPAELPDGLVGTLADAGVLLAGGPGEVCVLATGVLRAVETATGPHPGLPTDTAPQLAAMLTQARGTSCITERVYPRRDSHVQGLAAFGAEVSSRDSRVFVHGATRLRAADVAAQDIRAVTALLLAALAAEGTSTIRGMYHLRRGYGHLLTTLATLGADITTIPEARP